MKRNEKTTKLFLELTIRPFFFLSVLILTSIVTLSSCDTFSGKKYKFKSESMHWLQFRGPNASGIAPENADPPIYFSADSNLLWKTEILPGWSSPCIVNDKIFLTGFNDIDSLLYVFALNRENGEILWKDSIIPNGYYDMHSINSFANPTIASDGKRIFVAFPSYGLSSYDLEGIKLWEYPYEMFSLFYRGASSPVIKDSTVLIKISARNRSRIMGLDCKTGDSLWSISGADHKINVGSTSTLIIKDDLIINHAPKILWAYNLVNNEVKWQIPVPGDGISTPVISGEDIILNTYVQLGEAKTSGEHIPYEELLSTIDENENGIIEQSEFPNDMLLFSRPEIMNMDEATMYFKDDLAFAYFDANKDGSFDKTEWDGMWNMISSYMVEHNMMAISIEGSGERTIEDIKWKVNEDSPETPSPLIVNEHAFFIKNGGITTVIHRDSGNVVLKERLGAPGAYLSSPMLAGNRIYTCTFNGTVTVISGDDYSVLAQNKLKEKIGASPVAVDDVLYIRTDKHMYAFR